MEVSEMVNFQEYGKRHTLSPACTGTSVLGIKYAGGIIIAADMLVSYGSLARFLDVERVAKINDTTVIACSGDVADYQLLKRRIDEQTHTDNLLSDGFKLSPRALHCWITRVLYNRRSKLNPLWNSYIVGGREQDGKPFLGFCNLLGVSYMDDCLATGFGSYLAIPLLRQRLEDIAEGDPNKLSENDAVQAITDAMRQLYFRDCRAFNTYQLAFVRSDGVEIRGPLQLESDWSIAEYVAGYE
ncbi:Proteasome subunit beta type [Paragonimus heterotremus]|uniref:Proteasome subunit beta n=1 Tax=Paragonimus heterotremus TaxID=100268 RepID=A0A8J4T5T2_9TREM|nr:Proteasome subunit beta type [Paragonimus heterotremus]